MSVGKGHRQHAEQQVGDGEVDEKLLQIRRRPFAVELDEDDQRVGGEGEEGDERVEDNDRRLTTGPEHLQTAGGLLHKTVAADAHICMLQIIC